MGTGILSDKDKEPEAQQPHEVRKYMDSHSTN